MLGISVAHGGMNVRQAKDLENVFLTVHSDHALVCPSGSGTNVRDALLPRFISSDLHSGAVKLETPGRELVATRAHEYQRHLTLIWRTTSGHAETL